MPHLQTNTDKPRVAIVLFNLGGPDKPEAVRPFLFNLFYDPAILSLPNPFRYVLARVISSRRAPVAREIYAHLGGGSPLVPLTQRQADALKSSLQDLGDVKVFLCMRYWHPMSDETAQSVKEFAPDYIIALPLYPQYSTTTTASSFRDWNRAARRNGLDVPTRYVCSYAEQEDFIRAHVENIVPAYTEAKAQGKGKPRILFSAHGLPEKVVKAGDPYQRQVERTTARVMESLRVALGDAELDFVNCYQSRVGPLKWIGPSTEDEIQRGGQDKVPLVVVPIAFVSEHSETLVELDIEYGKLAEEQGVPYYKRVAALGDTPAYIQALATLTRHILESEPCCSSEWEDCPCAQPQAKSPERIIL